MTTFRSKDAALVPEEFRTTIKAPDRFNFDYSFYIEYAKIRAALEEKCGQCGGKGTELPHMHGRCPVCRGSGLRQIPGVERVSE